MVFWNAFAKKPASDLSRLRYRPAIEAHVLVNGFPVALENRFERALSHVVVFAARADDRRLVRLRKAMLRVADVCVPIRVRVRIFLAQ